MVNYHKGRDVCAYLGQQGGLRELVHTRHRRCHQRLSELLAGAKEDLIGGTLTDYYNFLIFAAPLSLLAARGSGRQRVRGTLGWNLVTRKHEQGVVKVDRSTHHELQKRA